MANAAAERVGMGRTGPAGSTARAIAFVRRISQVEEKCFSSTEKSPASTIFGRNFGFDVDFGA